MSSKSKIPPPSILLTNDDGIFAKGLESLVTVLREKASHPGSGPGVRTECRGARPDPDPAFEGKKIFKNGDFFGYGVSGTPADCVKIALHELIIPPPRLLISGINLGPNVGINVIYSGTVSAATEGAMMGLTSMAVSIDSYQTREFETAARIVSTLVDLLIKSPLPPGVSLNVNIPDRPLSEIKGIRLVKQGTFRFRERFERRIDPRENVYYWQAGILPPPEEAPDTDHALLSAGYVTLTPITFDLTHYPSLTRLTFLEKTVLGRNSKSA